MQTARSHHHRPMTTSEPRRIRYTIAAALMLLPFAVCTATAAPMCGPGQVVVYDAWHPFGMCDFPRGDTPHGQPQTPVPNGPVEPQSPNASTGVPNGPGPGTPPICVPGGPCASKGR
jgi:hypothetical protein